jgi:hypothetical protein
MPKDDAAIFELLLDQAKQLRQVKLELEALKRMFFEHRPPFVEAFAQQRGAVESSGFLGPLDEAIQRVERMRQP